ncbi:daptide-type RiPP biosynthesis aminotransferase [Saccharothrix sp. NPDC042600]|uniref:daptide-type RiPP biosynthesis aminotransferase n=1 Tax=Saccharothrix TaxID=2071 RepID=UPI0033F752CC|nr:aspartate aminotransferase family protein [Saccharothrix mutabilis subsp. capreolus]
MRDPYPLWEFLTPPSEHGRPERMAVAAEGTRVRFADGRWALCATSGLWNVNLGYGNRAVAEAVARALLEASYLTLFRAGHVPAVTAARALLDACDPDGLGKVLFSTSGSAANDLAQKVARLYWALRGEPGRRVVVGLRGSYHGMTYGAFALTGERLGQDRYGVDRRLVRHVAHDDDGAGLRTLLRREADRIAAVVVEPVLGSGAHVLTSAFLSELDRLRREHGFLLVADEVATGFGRTGRLFASQGWPFRPDMVITSKGLTNGTCGAAAVMVSHAISSTVAAADAVLVHGETQAGTPSTCAAILATLAETDRLDALGLASRLSAELTALAEGLADHPLVEGHRGTGCFRALLLRGTDGHLDADQVARVVTEIAGEGALVQPGPSAVQLVPALTYGVGEVAELEQCVRKGLDRAAEVLVR